MENNSFQTIDSIGHLRFIRELSDGLTFQGERVIKGIGDDAAVIDGKGSSVDLLTSETLLEGVNFDLSYTPLHHLGYKIVTAAVSDIYAMNGLPEALLINLALPNKISVEMAKEIYKGVEAAEKDYRVQVVGGDLNASHQLLNISVTAYGSAEEKNIVYRSGASRDDAICITGDLGGAIAGLRILMREKQFWQESDEDHFQPDLEEYEYVVKRQLVPVARKDLIHALEEHSVIPTAMIDVTQGLVSDIHQLAASSKVGAYIYQAAIPIALDTRQVADEMQEDVDKYALYGGEDYELLFTLPEEKVDELADHFEDFVVIGKITDRSEGVKMQNQEGDIITFEEEQDS